MDRLKLIVVGAGEHGRVVIEAARSKSEEWEILGFVDPQSCPETASKFGIPDLGAEESVRRAARESDDVRLILGVAGTRVSPKRSSIVEWFGAGVRWATVMHTVAWVSPSAVLGEGTVVLPYAVVHTGATVGRHCIINTGAIVEHDVRLGDFSSVSPGVAIGGGTIVGESSYLGLGCRIRDHIEIGRSVTVGMGAVVVKSVEDGETVMGFPARPSGSS
jgi:acetyltransferase EpsM